MQIKLLLTFIFMATISYDYAQDYNPFKSIGKKGRILTASNGEFVEVFDYNTIQRIGSVMFNINSKKIVKLLDANKIFRKYSNNSSSSRWYSVDPLAYTMRNNSISPYVFVRDNPILLIDPDGRDWFYYQVKDEKNKTWHFQEGNKATYTNTKGKEVTTSKGFDYLVTYKVTSKNSEGASTGTITVYNQNKAVLTSTGFAGTEKYIGMEPIPSGNYMMNLSKRDGDGPNKLVPSGNGRYKPQPDDGIQAIPNDAQFEYKGREYSMNPTVTDPYGNGRVRLNQTDGDLNVVPFYQQPAGYYLHGKQEDHNWTHGCICDKSEEVFNYFWSGEGKDIRGYVPLTVIK